VTEKSVEVHLGRAHRKLGIRSRWPAIRGLIGAEGLPLLEAGR
jgi:DNA-binding CsgD family transcriptional regulator